jgi:hypothetical protein
MNIELSYEQINSLLELIERNADTNGWNEDLDIIAYELGVTLHQNGFGQDEEEDDEDKEDEDEEEDGEEERGTSSSP